MVNKKIDNDSQNQILTASAIAKSVKVSPQKVNLVLGLIRGLDAEQALNVLEFSNKRISNEVKKILKSAISNAENNHQLDIDKLVVHEAIVGKSMVMKRFRARARGRSAKILKPFSKIKIVVRETDVEKNIDKKELKTQSVKTEDVNKPIETSKKEGKKDGSKS